MLYFGKVSAMNSSPRKSIIDAPYTVQLLNALKLVAASDSLGDFLRDVMTEKEIIEISARFEAARLLTEGKSYEYITQKTKLSSRTIARISQWLKDGTGGYSEALKALGSADLHHAHMTPARAE